ncbi:MAG: undecaprenyl-phosphate glucose phosphotransferase [Nitrospinota bacterium]|nr:undecaprenyl-phosphate glucose phosphotransferase [Nitrospinota bacterium]
MILKRYGQLNVFLLCVSDIIALILTWFFSFYLRFTVEIIPVRLGHPYFFDYLILLPYVLFLWFISARITHLYEFRIGLKSTQEILRLSATIFLTVLLMIAITFFYRETSYSRVMFLLFLIISPGFLFLIRRLFWSLIRRFRRLEIDFKKILIVGTSSLATKVAEQLEEFRYLGFQVVGYISEIEPPPNAIGGFPVLGSLSDVKEIVESNKIAEVYVALTSGFNSEREKLLKSLNDSSVDLRLVPDLVEHMRLNAGIEQLGGLPVILLSQSPLFGWNTFVKRFMDIIISFLLVIILSPILLLTALLVKLGSSGPIFYVQERMGLDGISFQMYKFRSMRIGAESETGPVWAKSDDNRRTFFGSFLRKLNLDELPQLFNVLRGEMSLVGPRPERPFFVEQFRSTVPGYMLRHKMKSGITGWAQVNGWRGDTSLEKRIEFDLFYIENWSVGFDLKILWLTLWKSFLDKNAY